MLNKLHLGCGSVVLPGWKNLDLAPPIGGIVCDLRQPLPELSDSVDYIFHEHFIEHLTREDGERLFRECHRVLKPGGVMRFSTPDLMVIAEAYLHQKIDFWKGVWEPKTPAQLLNGALREWDHKFVYDEDEMQILLIDEIGFSSAVSMAYKKSDHEALKDLEIRPYFEELIMEATK